MPLVLGEEQLVELSERVGRGGDRVSDGSLVCENLVVVSALVRLRVSNGIICTISVWPTLSPKK